MPKFLRITDVWFLNVDQISEIKMSLFGPTASYHITLSNGKIIVIDEGENPHTFEHLKKLIWNNVVSFTN